MMDEAERLLDAEAAVQELLQDLVRLKDEVDSYSTASKCLDEAKDGLNGLVSRVGDLAAGAVGIIDTLGKIGTPEIIGKIDGLVESLSERLDDMQADLTQSTDRITKSVVAGLREQETREARRHRNLTILVIAALVLSGLAAILSVPAIAALLGL